MKKIHFLPLFPALILLIAFGIASCGGAETKADSSDTLDKKKPPTSSQPQTQPVTEEKIPDNTPAPSAKTRGGVIGPENNEILAHIDKYLVSKADFPAPPASGGIRNATVSLQNTLSDITFQKAILEVSILLPDGLEFRTDYYILQNIDPGDVKTVKIPNATRGNSISSHVVKLKSTQLTNGELILVGSNYVAQ